MALYDCSICGSTEVTMNDIRSHLKREHNYKKGQETMIFIRYVKRGKDKGYKNTIQKYIIV